MFVDGKLNNLMVKITTKLLLICGVVSAVTYGRNYVTNQ